MSSYKADSPARGASGGRELNSSGGEARGLLEGDWQPTRLVVLEVEDLTRFDERWTTRRVPGGERASARAPPISEMVAVQGSS